MNLSPHFTLAEMTRSDVARRYGISNTPNAAQTENLRLLCTEVLEPLRGLFGDKPVHISSGYRCPALNRHPEVGGARNSQHQRGTAADLSIKGYTIKQLFDAIIASGIPFDQCIEEFGRWIHISYSPNPRRQALVARRIAGEVKYTQVKKP